MVAQVRQHWDTLTLELKQWRMLGKFLEELQSNRLSLAKMAT